MDALCFFLVLVILPLDNDGSPSRLIVHVEAAKLIVTNGLHLLDSIGASCN